MISDSDLRRLDGLDDRLAQAKRSPISRGRIKLPKADFDFLLDLIGPQSAQALGDLDPVPSRDGAFADQISERHGRLEMVLSSAVVFTDNVNLSLEDFGRVLHLAHEAAQNVSIDEAVQRG